MQSSFQSDTWAEVNRRFGSFLSDSLWALSLSHQGCFFYCSIRDWMVNWDKCREKLSLLKGVFFLFCFIFCLIVVVFVCVLLLLLSQVSCSPGLPQSWIDNRRKGLEFLLPAVLYFDYWELGEWMELKEVAESSGRTGTDVVSFVSLTLVSSKWVSTQPLLRVMLCLLMIMPGLLVFQITTEQKSRLFSSVLD